MFKVISNIMAQSYEKINVTINFRNANCAFMCLLQAIIREENVLLSHYSWNDAIISLK